MDLRATLKKLRIGSLVGPNLPGKPVLTRLARQPWSDLLFLPGRVQHAERWFRRATT